MNVDEVLRADSGLGKVMGDVLRTLYLCAGALWLPELLAELEGFKSTLGESPYTKEEVEKAVKELKAMGLVEVRPGIRATMEPQGEKTVLISLKRSAEVISSLSSDSRISHYRKIWEEVMSQLR